MVTSPPSSEATASGDATLGPEGSRPSRASRLLQRGDVIGRYVMIERVGAGGMGVVYAAYDPDLDRKIALKLLHPRHEWQGADASATARLLREAQATARLNHPNVITVHDVGALDEGVFIAMEYLDGGTLEQWCHAAERSLSQILAQYLEAGRGLSAAHSAGLVHRDFKPDNVLLGADGRVRVADFGLAREPESTEVTEGSSTALEANPRLTRTGALMGTPAYMSPEQHLGEPADARSDQFSYCVALYEALCGRRPWSGDTVPTIMAAVLEEDPGDLPAAVPAHVRRAILRGLSRDPEERWPSMDELLAVLSQDPAASRRRARRVAVATGLAAITFGVAWVAWSRVQEEPCAGGPSRLAEVWDPVRAERIAAAMRGTGLGYAEQAAIHVPAELDRYGDAWVAAYTDACRATRVLEEQSERLLDLRMSCLDRRLVALGAMVEVLARADAKTTQSAVRAVDSLPSLEPCSNRDVLLAAVAPPDDPGTAAAVEAARASLAHVDALVAAGHYDEALELASRVVGELEDVDYPPALAEALLAKGLAHGDRAEHEASVADHERGFHLALASGDDELGARIASALIYTEGYDNHRPERALLWADHADALVRRVGSLPEVASNVAAGRAAVSFTQGRVRESIELYERALALRIEVHGEDDEAVWSLRSNIAAALGELEDFERALPLQQQVIAATERKKGPRHPDVASRLANHAMTLVAASRHDEARELFERALEIREEVLGPDHPDVSVVLGSLGAVHLYQDHLDEAERYFRRAHDVTRRHGDVVGESIALANLGNVASSRGEHARASAIYLEVLEIQRRELGDHPYVAMTLHNLAFQAVTRGAWDEARGWAEQAVATFDRVGEADTPFMHTLLLQLGSACRQAGDPRAALAPLERALAMAETMDDPAARAETALELARALGAIEQELPRARTLAASARQTFEQAGKAELAAEARRWLLEHGE